MTTRAAAAPLPLVGKARSEGADEPSDVLKGARAYPFTTKYLPWRPNIPELLCVAGVADYVEACDAINECEHGFMPGDKEPTRPDLKALWDKCECHDRTPVSQPCRTPATPARHRAKPATAVPRYGETMAQLQAPARRVYTLDLPPFIANVVQDLDGEAERLRQELDRLATVRAALTE